MTITCAVCGADVHEHEDCCVRCTSPQGFPNVRVVGRRKERDALVARSMEGRRQAADAGALVELARLVEMTSVAHIAFNRSLAQLFEWWSSPDKMFRPWIWHVTQGRRVIPDTFNSGRISFEHNVNPNYSQNINFGYLDVGAMNLAGYGGFKVLFRDSALNHRTTFLETNAYYFCQRNRVVDPASMPLGYRAARGDVGLLAEAKLGSKVRMGMTDDQLRYLLLHDTDASGPAEFLEAHIYNPIHVSAVDQIVGPAPLPTEASMLDYVRASFATVGVEVRITK